MANRYLNPDPKLHTDMLRQQVEIGEMLLARFKKEERHDEAIGLNLELNKIMTIIYERSRKSN